MCICIYIYNKNITINRTTSIVVSMIMVASCWGGGTHDVVLQEY